MHRSVKDIRTATLPAARPGRSGRPALSARQVTTSRSAPGSTPDTLQRSLHALAHPITLGAILLLVLNDHVLKQAVPSVLTGKLSDLAGLFFLPYLLGAGLGLLQRGLAQLRPGRRDLTGTIWVRLLLSGAPYVATAGLFALIKLDPSFNRASNRLLQFAMGQPVWIVRDPSDLMALLALLPSWRLWSGAPDSRPPLRRSLAALGLSTLAVLATSPCLPEQSITHLISHGGQLYAAASAWQPLSNAYVAADQGRTWDYVAEQELPASVAEAAQAPVPLPKTVCAPGMEHICYRASGEEQVEVSSDGGQTWHVVWQVSRSRRSYMERLASGHGQMLACGKPLDLRATDIAVLGVGEAHAVIVAIGNEGVLRGRYDQAEWDRVSVGLAEPTPERGGLEQLFPPLIILGETVRALAAGAGVFLLLTALAARRAPRRLDSLRALRISGTTAVLVTIAHWVPFALWVPGWVPWYSAAFWLSLVASVAVLLWGIGRLPAAGRPVDEPLQPSS